MSNKPQTVNLNDLKNMSDAFSNNKKEEKENVNNNEEPNNETVVTSTNEKSEVKDEKEDITPPKIVGGVKIISTPENKQNVAEISKPEPDNEPTVKVTNKDEVVESKKLRYIKDHIKRYLDLCKEGNLHKTTQDISAKVRSFQNILEYALNNPEKEVLDEVYKFFHQNKDQILDPRFALQGVHRLQRPIRERIETMYTLFRSITNDYKGKNNYEVARQILGNQDAIFVYIQEKESLMNK